MLTAYTAAAVRAAEQPFLDAGRGPELMQTAAYGLAMGVASILRHRGGLYGARVALLIGPGNNGGDALFAGAWLASRGVRTTALLTSSRTHGQALAAFVKAGGRCLTLEADPEQPDAPRQRGDFMAEARASGVVIDGLLGTGGRGGLRGPVAEVVAELEALVAPDRPAVVACDLPSGVNASTGEVSGAVLRAELTVTFGAHKSGLLAPPGEQLCGEVRLVDLGISGSLGAGDLRRLELADLRALLPQPSASDHKYTRGVAGIVAGSQRYPGAALLAVAAASACGPGMVRYQGPEQVAAALHLRNPEVVCSTDSPKDVRVQSWVVGPGIDGDAQQLQRALDAMASGLPTVVDAGALALVAPPDEKQGGPGGDPVQGHRRCANASMILTPHAGELATLVRRHGLDLDRAAIEAAPLAAARSAARLTGAVVLLKGATTIVAAPDGTVYTQANGTPWLATAGSGDTLAGILGALLALTSASAGASGPIDAPPSSHDLAKTAALAAALHGELSRHVAAGPLNAGQLARLIPEVWTRLCQIDPLR